MLHDGGIVRHIYPGEDDGGGFQPSFAAALATAAGVAAAGDRRSCSTTAPRKTARPRSAAFRRNTCRRCRPRGSTDAIVLIGADLPNQDTFRTPLSVAQSGATMAGIFIHAQALAQLLDGVRFRRSATSRRRRFSCWPPRCSASRCHSLPLRAYWKVVIALGVSAAYWTFAFAYFAAGGALLPLLSPTLGFVARARVRLTYARRRDQLEKRLSADAFGRYVSPPIIEQILADPRKLALGGEKREMSFVFSDLEGFTTLAESLPPERRSALLQSYLDGMLRIAFEHGGTVDRIVGDGIAVFFGAPLDQPDHARRAVACALAWDRYCERFRETHRGDGVALGITRIGVHTGTAIVGNVGTAERCTTRRTAIA